MQKVGFTRLSADVLQFFTIFLAIVFSEKHPGYSNKYFWKFPKFSIFCLHWKLPLAIFLSFSWDNKCKFSNNPSKTVARKMLFFWRHLRKVSFTVKTCTLLLLTWNQFFSSLNFSRTWLLRVKSLAFWRLLHVINSLNMYT